MSELDKVAQVLESYDEPAILVSKDYEIMACNSAYERAFGALEHKQTHYCYQVSHGFDKPCDQSGEACPLSAVEISKQKERVLHVHQTKNGREYVDIEMVPIFDGKTVNQISHFVEVLKPVPLGSGKLTEKEIIGEAPCFKQTLSLAIKAASSKVSIMIYGDSGTGKGLIAKLIHLSSQRNNLPFVILDCPGMNENQFEAELFGQERNNYQQRLNLQLGLAEQANGGTLLLDEIGDLSMDMQVKLLRLIENRTFKRIGGDKLLHSDFRLICTSSHNLEERVKLGTFRQDLFYRINVYPIRLPNLSQRSDDIPELTKLFLSRSGKKQITQSAIEILKQVDYEGNISQLRNLAVRASVLCETNLIDENDIKQALAMDTQPRESTKETKMNLTLKQLEQHYLADLLNRHQGNKHEVAVIAGISLRSLYRKLEEK